MVGFGGVKPVARNTERDGRRGVWIFIHPFQKQVVARRSHPTRPACILEARPSDGSCRWAAKFLSRVVSGAEGGGGSNGPANRTSLKEPIVIVAVELWLEQDMNKSAVPKGILQADFGVLELWAALGDFWGLLGTFVVAVGASWPQWMQPLKGRGNSAPSPRQVGCQAAHWMKRAPPIRAAIVDFLSRSSFFSCISLSLFLCFHCKVASCRPPQLQPLHHAARVNLCIRIRFNIVSSNTPSLPSRHV